MGTREEYIELFDKYSLGTITKAEEKKMRFLIQENLELKLEFKSHQLLVEGIKLARKEELKDYLKEHGKVEYFQNIWGKKWSSISAVIVLLFTCSFFAVQYLSKKAAKEMAVANKENISQIEEPKQNAEKPATEKKEEPLELENLANSKSKDKLVRNNELLVQEDAFVDDTSGIFADEIAIILNSDVANAKPQTIAKKRKENKKEYRELPVAEERKIFDTLFFAEAPSSREYKFLDKESTTSAEMSTKFSTFKNKEDLEDSLKGNKHKERDTALFEEEPITKPAPIPVEIWQSPLNFKGYQYVTKLKIYGVNKESISFINYAHEIYLKVNSQYCKLIKSKEYFPFKFITDQNLINKLNGN
jgi:hypothetical protein